MKISILTATYNRANCLEKLYQSLLENSNYGVDLEWLIMDNSSTDDTKNLIEQYIKEAPFEIKYFFRKNQGKMIAINELVPLSEGDLIMECDSDDYLTNTAVKIIKGKYSLLEKENDIYAFAFLKYDQNLCNIGNTFKNDKYKSTMFDLYFKDGITGDKALVFVADIRKKYKYQLENNENFITEARMFHEMDKSYRISCFNQPIMICEYLDNGYSKNIIKIFKENPYGYYMYFQEMFDFDMDKVLFAKKLYIIKHYILFSYLTKQKHILKNVKGAFNKFLTAILLIPRLYQVLSCNEGIIMIEYKIFNIILT